MMSMTTVVTWLPMVISSTTRTSSSSTCRGPCRTLNTSGSCRKLVCQWVFCEIYFLVCQLGVGRTSHVARHIKLRHPDHPLGEGLKAQTTVQTAQIAQHLAAAAAAAMTTTVTTTVITTTTTTMATESVAPEIAVAYAVVVDNEVYPLPKA